MRRNRVRFVGGFESALVGAAALGAAMFASARVGARQDSDAPGPQVRLITAYFGDRPVSGIRRLTLTGRPGAEMTVILDPNNCTMDAYGEPQQCTQVGFKRFEVRLKPVHVPPAEQGLGALIGRLYDIEGLPEHLPRMRAVLSDKPGAFGRLLIRDEKGDVSRVITLEPMAG